MSNRILAILAASLMAAASPAAYADPGSGKGGGESQGASSEAPGHDRSDSSGNGASADAPGHQKGDGESARGYAPGQQFGDDDSDDTDDVADDDAADDEDDVASDDDPTVDDETTASIGDTNFGTVISSLRAGKSALGDIDADSEFQVVDVSDVIKGNNRAALDNALSANEDAVDDLREELADLNTEFSLDLEADVIDNAVAVRQTADGSVMVYVDGDG